MNNRTYTIINSIDLSGITFSEVLETSINTVRKNNDNTQSVLKYVGLEPSSLVGISKITTNNRNYHNQMEIIEVMGITGTTGWANNINI